MNKEAELKVYNDTFIEMTQGGPEQIKLATTSMNTFTRNKLREESFAEKILTPVDIANDELHPAEDPELLVRWTEREPDVAPAMSVPLGVTPDGQQFKGTRYPTYFSRLISPVFNKDVDKLRGYGYDIRQVMLDLSTKEIATVIDTKLIDKCDAAMGLINTANALNGLSLPQYVSISGGITRSNVEQAFEVISKLRVPFGPMQPNGGESQGVMLANNVTAMRFTTFERSEVGGDESQRAYLEGTPPPKIMGVKMITTIKRDLIPDNTIYLFSSEEFFGKYYRLQPLTVFMENKAYWLSFFQYINLGMSIGNVKGVCRVDFT